jgi:glycosyltransferase involved in cell wall biosynthesis
LILTVGRFVQQKSHITLLDALPRLLAACPTVMLAWVGQGPLEVALRSRARALGVAAHICFLGSRSDVPDLMGAADLLCMPSYFEGHPLVALEALAAGLPVVATRSVGITEAIRNGETGLLCPFNNAPVLAHTLARLLADPELMAQLGAAGAAWARGRVGAWALHHYPHGARHDAGLPPDAGRAHARDRGLKAQAARHNARDDSRISPLAVYF